MTPLFETATFSKDGLLAAVGCQDGSIRVYDVPASLKVEKDTTTNTMLCKMMDMCAPVEAMAFHPDGQILVAGSSVGKLVLSISILKISSLSSFIVMILMICSRII